MVKLAPLPRSRVAGSRGQALVEFALVIPMFILMVVGGLDLGRAYFYKNDTMHLANVAVRFATVGKCAPCGGQTIDQYVEHTVATGGLAGGGGQIESPGAQVTFCYTGSGAKGESIKATVKATYDWLPYFKQIAGLNPNTEISSTATMMLEKAYDPSSPYPAAQCT